MTSIHKFHDLKTNPGEVITFKSKKDKGYVNTKYINSYPIMTHNRLPDGRSYSEPYTILGVYNVNHDDIPKSFDTVTDSKELGDNVKQIIKISPKNGLYNCLDIDWYINLTDMKVCIYNSGEVADTITDIYLYKYMGPKNICTCACDKCSDYFESKRSSYPMGII